MPLTGGFETSTYELQLDDVPGGVPGKLILRIFRKDIPEGKALWESMVQNAVSATGYPAPHVFLSCSDKSILGGEFNLMEKMPGIPMLKMPSEKLPETLGRLHATLHKIDPSPLMRTLKENGIDERRFGMEGTLNWIRRSVDSVGYGWLTPGIDWLEENRPEIREVSICHGDFHPLNILMEDDEVSGVIDWSGFRITDPHLDVAFTEVILSIAAPALLSGFVSEDFVNRYLSAYQRELTLMPKRLRYFQALRCVMAFLEGSNGQLVWRRPDILSGLSKHLQESSGLRIKGPSHA